MLRKMARKIESHANILRLPVMKANLCMYAQINITDFVGSFFEQIFLQMDQINSLNVKKLQNI